MQRSWGRKEHSVMKDLEGGQRAEEREPKTGARARGGS